eukprot:GILJ01001753.1.p2 GENE.GILJ01001753.1~~GILJ01001753.1.p2  ORF type:complete len:106 (+),score=21.34 GILJ01001753.1:813-1130(+)
MVESYPSAGSVNIHHAAYTNDDFQAARFAAAPTHSTAQQQPPLSLSSVEFDSVPVKQKYTESKPVLGKADKRIQVIDAKLEQNMPRQAHQTMAEVLTDNEVYGTL